MNRKIKIVRDMCNNFGVDKYNKDYSIYLSITHLYNIGLTNTRLPMQRGHMSRATHAGCACALRAGQRRTIPVVGAQVT